MTSHDGASSVSSAIPNPFRRRQRTGGTPVQTEITPASMSIPPESPGVSTSSQRGPSFQELVELLDSVRDDQRRQAVAEMNRFSKDIKEEVIDAFIENGAIPALLRLLIRPDLDIHFRIRVAATLCNLAQGRQAQNSFIECRAVQMLAYDVIGLHPALTGAAALMLKFMLVSEELVRAMIEHEAPIILIRGLMLCDNVEINDVIIDVLIQMTSVEELKTFMIENRAVESCVYFLHVLAHSHYSTSTRESYEFSSNSETGGRPGFLYKTMRDALIWSLVGSVSLQSRPSAPVGSPHLSLAPQPQIRDWTLLLKNSPVIGNDRVEMNFTMDSMKRVGLFMEVLSHLTDNTSPGCNRLAGMQFSLDILAYWIRRGNSLVKQGALLTTCYLLRQGYRGFTTLKDVVEAIMCILQEPGDPTTDPSNIRQKCIAAEAVNDLSIYGGQNVQIAIAAAGILRPMLIVLEIPDFQLQHLTLRALHTICVHPVALGNLVNYGAIPFLCHFLGIGLSQHQGTRIIRAASFGYNHGCISRKRVATISMTQAEIDLSNRREQDYSRSRRLDYSAALLRCIAAVQSSEWIHDLNKCRIVPITLDALVQNYSVVLRRQALGILASIVTLRDSNISMSICVEGGCNWLLNLRSQVEKLGDVESSFWIAWINFVLYCLAQNKRTRRFVEQAIRDHVDASIDLRGDSQIHQILKPEQMHLDLKWIASTS